MQGLFDREVVSQFAIILAISLGGWLLFVHPKVQKLQEFNKVFNVSSGDKTDLSGETITRLAQQLSYGRNHITKIEYLNKLSENTTLLYSLISDLGARHDIVVKSINPGAESTNHSRDGYISTRVDMTIEGRYEDIAAFIQSVKELPGFLRPVYLVIQPDGDGKNARAKADLSCQAIQFEMSEALLAMRRPQ